ncbi:MAG: hypothetical protein ABIH39_04545 [Candidatus Margulisiibacteriota bacterium]
MMNKLLLPLILVLFFAIISSAEWFDPSETATDALTLGIGAIEGFADSAAAVFQNPAGLSKTKNLSLSTFRTTIMDDTVYSNAAVAFSSQWGRVGVGVVQLKASGIAHTGVDQYGEYECISEVGYSNDIYYLSFAPDIKGYHIGYTIKYLSSDLGGLAGSAINADIGTYMTDFIYQGLDISALAKNVLTTSKYKYADGSSQEIPMKILLSMEYELSERLQLYSQIRFIKKQTPVNTCAIGVKYTPEFLPFMAVYSGWRELLIEDNKKDGITCGVSIHYSNMALSYAFERTEYILNNNNHYVSFSINY